MRATTRIATHGLSLRCDVEPARPGGLRADPLPAAGRIAVRAAALALVAIPTALLLLTP